MANPLINSGDAVLVVYFTLSYSGSQIQKNNVMNYIEDILSTITEGATSLQMSSQHNIFVVPVKTNMRLLDFDLLDINSKQFKSSVQEGRKSFISFLNNYSQ